LKINQSIFEICKSYLTEIKMPHNSDVENPDLYKYQSLCGYYPTKERLFEYTLCQGKLVSSKIYHKNGNLLHELNVTDQGSLINAKEFFKNGKVKRTFEKNHTKDTPLLLGESYNGNSSIIFKGEFFDEKRCGFGTEYDSKGVNKYSGVWLDDKLQGKGIQFFENGQRMFDGNYDRGKKNGFGTSFYENGSKKYDGSWENDLWHGKGKCYHSNNVPELDGEFWTGPDRFQGMKYDKHSRKLCQGMFFYSKLHGDGIQYYPENGNVMYKGSWKDDTWHGYGSLYHISNFWFPIKRRWHEVPRELQEQYVLWHRREI
jgi:antitoxin component YwqK of YwqJK toxin-antitoxin module